MAVSDDTGSSDLTNICFDVTESQLCIPQDPIEEVLECFPNFNNDLISLSLTHEDEPPLLFNDFEIKPSNLYDIQINDFPIMAEDKMRPPSFGSIKKQQRTKRQPSPYWEFMSNNKFKSEKRKCRHCQTDKTPQWRIGPLGPKTLCNACGVRYKSGRLLPEYRPAASPTFNCLYHSNFHKKIMKKKEWGRLI